MRTLEWKGLGLGVALAIAGLTTLAPPATATSMLPQNVVDLVDLSERIFTGQVVSLSDGFDRDGLPYTEVSVRIDESIRGANGSVYTFRQFGLLAPREMADGSTYLGVSPDGWPKFRENEEVMLFLYRPALETGLQTTVGLLQGKFTIEGGTITNAIGNANVFHGVDFSGGTLNSVEELLRDDDARRMPADAFVSMVRRAVQERWVENGRMIHAQ